MMICNLKFNYVFNDILKWYSKLDHLFNIVLKLQKILHDNGINTNIETNNIYYDSASITGKYEILYDIIKTKEPFYNIKLVLNTNEDKGGAKPPKKRTVKKRTVEKQVEKKEREFENFKALINDFDIKDLKLLNNKIIIEFNLEYFHPLDENDKLKELFDINKYETYYIDKYKGLTKDYFPGFLNPITSRKMLNKLNLNGLLTYSYLNSSKTEVESGINIEKIRQDLILNKILKTPNKIIKKFKIIKDNYEKIFKNFLSYNLFFIEKINDIIVNNIITDNIINIIDNYLISLFRNSLNAFIIKINQELFSKYGIKLFISGGDAMRRYNYNIAFTSDIDTKLHIKDLSNDNKKDIIDIIILHIVNLRNYLEENKMKIFQELITEENNGLNVFTFKSNNYNIGINILLEPEERNEYQQFRTREIKKNDLFPVDLYSLDFRYTIHLHKDKSKKIIYNHQLSILDVVIIDTKKYKDEDIEEINNITYASKKFLLEDIENTYNNELMALARISNNKSEKDIYRYKELKLITTPNDDYNKSINKIIEELDKIDLSILNENLKYILNKIKNQLKFTIKDYVILITLKKNELEKINNKYIIDFLKNIINNKTNLPFENLNELDIDYNTYTINKNNSILKKYYKTFKHICNNNDGLFKHMMSYSNKSILYIYNKYYDYYYKKFDIYENRLKPLNELFLKEGHPRQRVKSISRNPGAAYNPTLFFNPKPIIEPLPISNSSSPSNVSTPYTARSPTPNVSTPYSARSPTPVSPFIERKKTKYE